MTSRVLKKVAQLLLAIRAADTQELEQAVEVLEKFSEAWLITGDGMDLEGAGDCCLSDTDITNAIKEVIESTRLA